MHFGILDSLFALFPPISILPAPVLHVSFFICFFFLSSVGIVRATMFCVSSSFLLRLLIFFFPSTFPRLHFATPDHIFFFVIFCVHPSPLVLIGMLREIIPGTHRFLAPCLASSG